MPRKGGKLTPQERAFIPVMARTGDATYAAEKARLAFPVVAGNKMMQRPAVVAEVKSQQFALIVTDLLPKAVAFAEHALTLGNDVPHGVRATVMKEVLKYSAGGLEDLADKDMADMTADELSRASAALRRELAERAERAKPIVEGSTIEPDKGAFE